MGPDKREIADRDKPRNPFKNVAKRVKLAGRNIRDKSKPKKPSLLPSDPLRRKKLDVNKLDLQNSYVGLVHPVRQPAANFSKRKGPDPIIFTPVSTAGSVKVIDMYGYPTPQQLAYPKQMT